MLVFKLILAIIFICLLVLVLTDVIINGSSIYKRWKIGRWEDKKQWLDIVTSVSDRWFYHAPVVKKTDQTRYLLKDMMQGNYKNNTIQSWQTGGLYLGLSEKGQDVNKLQSQFIDMKTGEWKEKPREVDYALLAYGILKSTDDVQKIKPAMDEIYQLILDRYQESDQTVCYRKFLPKIRFVDTIGFICPFLMCYAKRYHCEKARIIAKNQIEQYYKKAYLKHSGLIAHAYDNETEVPLGSYGWGRGTGWWMLGIIDSYLENPSEQLKSTVIETADKIAKFENNNGGFSSNLALKNNTESSITAIAAYFYQKCYEITSNKEYQKITDRCMTALMKNTRRNGEIDFSQGDTKGIGIYSQTYDIMPFTQGIVTRLKIEE